MYEVNRLLKERYPDDKKIKFLIGNSYKRQEEGFYVYAKADLNEDDDKYTEKINSDNVKGCVNYMMRYAGRPAMAESRILYYNKETDDVTWYYEDHKTGERVEVKEYGLELLQKMIIHIPDKSFKMVRYYGFYNNRCKDILEEIHSQLGKQGKPYRDSNKRKAELKVKLDKLKFHTSMADTYNKDIFKCDVCGHEFVYVYTHNPLEGISNDRQYRQDCIDEMRFMWLSRGSPGIYVKDASGASPFFRRI